MTRKDYIRLADALKKASHILVREGDAYQQGKIIGVHVATEFIADALQEENHRFARQHFLSVVRGEKELNSRP